MVGSDTWTREPRADFVILKIYNFDHKHILPIVHVLVVLVLEILDDNVVQLHDDIFEGLKPLMDIPSLYSLLLQARSPTSTTPGPCRATTAAATRTPATPTTSPSAPPPPPWCPPPSARDTSRCRGGAAIKQF